MEQGFVYRGKKPVYWSIPCRTALAEAEVEYKDHVSQSVYVKFPLVGHPGTSVVIWTTTPWTLPANLAVAYNSTFSYSLVQVGEEQFIVSALLLPAVAEKCGWQDYQIVRSLDGGHLSQLEYQHPFCNRTGQVLRRRQLRGQRHRHGFVHIAPGHGLEDYHLGTEHGLPIYSPVDDDGKFTHTSDLPRGAADAGRDARQIHPGEARQERGQRGGAARAARPQGAAAPGELPSQLPALLAQQDARSSSARWTSGSSRSTTRKFRERALRGDQPRQLGARLGQEPHRSRRARAGPTGASRASAPGACRSRRSTTRRATPSSTRRSCATPPP